MNVYGYVWNNPSNYIDPTGLYCVTYTRGAGVEVVNIGFDTWREGYWEALAKTSAYWAANFVWSTPSDGNFNTWSYKLYKHKYHDQYNLKQTVKSCWDDCTGEYIGTEELDDKYRVGPSERVYIGMPIVEEIVIDPFLWLL